MRDFFKAFIIIVFLTGCFSSENNNNQKQLYYYDLKSYFNQAAKKLTLQNPTVKKEVSKNNLKENKNLKIANWNSELALFADADINKAAWRESYTKDSSATKIVYTAKDSDLKTQKIEIDLENGKPVKFKINSKTDNLLYLTTEVLEFYVDSVYSIHKHQKVFLLGKNNYSIKGTLR